MGQPDDKLQQGLEAWRQGRASLDQVRSLAAHIGNQHFAPGIAALVELLDHEDEIVRYHAAMSLGFDLRYRPATDRLIVMLAEDTNEDCRDVAAGALKILWQDTKDRRTLEALAKAALNDPDEDVRRSAYEAFLIVNGVPREEHLRLLTGPRVRVDPARVDAILSEISR